MASSAGSHIVICYDTDARQYVLDCDSAPEGKMINYPLDQMDKSTLFGAVNDIITNIIIRRIEKNPKPEKNCLKIWSKNYCIMDFGDKNESYLKEILEIIENHNSGSIVTSAGIDVVVQWKYAFLQTKDPYGTQYKPSLQKVEHIPTPPIASMPTPKASTEKKMIAYKLVTSPYISNKPYPKSVVCGESIDNDEFGKKITEYLRKGYVLYGNYSLHTVQESPNSFYSFFSQPMCLYE